MKMPHQMTALMDRGGRPTVRELLSSLVFNPADGTIRLNGDRLIMQRAAFGAELRSQLVRTLGEDEARSFLIRLGFQLGKNDARFVRSSWQNLDIGDAFTAGTRLHTFTGVVRVETVQNDFDFSKRIFTGEFLWHDSVEAAEYVKDGSPSPHPVCWTQLGYASGYASEFFGTLIMYKEVSCAAEGHRHCRVIGKPADVWGEHDPEVVMFRTRVVPPGLPETVAALPGQGRATQVKPQRGSSAVDRVLLAPVVDGLERLAAARLPVLISGQPGTGKKRAAAYLHTALGAEGAGPARLQCGGLDVQRLAQQLGAKAGAAVRRQNVPKMLVLEDIELLSQEAQACLDGHLGELAKRETVIVATTSLAPRQLARVEGFRRDLWLKFSVHPICLAPLSSRRADVPLLADAMVSAIAERLRIRPPAFADGATNVLAAAALTGNLTELEATLASAILIAPADQPITAEALQEAQQGLAEADQADSAVSSLDGWLSRALSKGNLSMTELEMHIYHSAVDRAAGNLSAAARSLGLSRAQLAYRIKGGAKASPTVQQSEAG
jgi:hypothetical protein